MYHQGGYRPPSRDGGSYRDRTRDRRSDDRDGEYRRSRKDSPGPPRNLNYDDDEGTDGYSEADRDHSRFSRERYYSQKTSADSRWNDASHQPSVLDAINHVELRPGAPSVIHAAAGPLDETYRHRHGHDCSDSADYPHRIDGSSDAPQVGRHGGAATGRGDYSHIRDSRGYRSSVPTYRGHGVHHDGRDLDRRGSGRAVVLDGLPEDATERDILYGLDYVTGDRHFSSDKVRVARVRYDHNGYRIAFVEFHRRSDAEQFLDQYYPHISFPLEHTRGVDSESITVGVSSPKSRDDVNLPRDPRREDDGWDWDCIKCGAINYPHRAVCFKCKAEKPEDNYGASGHFLTGETDECPQQAPSQYVVVRDLEGSVTEEVLAKGVMKLFIENQEPAKEAPTTANKLKSTAPVNSTVGLGAKPGSLRRVFLMRDRKTNESWRYGFAEFATVEDAIAAVSKFRASAKFTIASKPVAVAFIHTGVFIPAFDIPTTENRDFSFTPIYNPTVRVKYWDERAYPSARVVATDPLPGADPPVGNDDPKSSGRPSKKVKHTKEPALAPKVAMIPQVQLWAKASAQLHGAKPTADSGSPPAEEPDEVRPVAARVAPRAAEETPSDGPVTPQPGDEYLSYANWDTMGCLTCGWEAPSQARLEERGCPQTRGDLLIEHEGRAHGFFQDDAVKEKAAAALAALGKKPRRIVRRTARLRSERLPVYKSYADFDRLRCVLCKRVFKDIRLVWLHEQQSELHKRMLADPQNRARAAAEFKALGQKMRILEPDAGFVARWEAQRARFAQQPQYRDRALERRRAFKQPKQPTGGSSHNKPAGGGSSSSSLPEKRKEPSSETAAERDGDRDKEQQQPAAKKSKGAGMLAKMGWTAGAGLGAEGAGRTEAIATEVYAPGVGLGAEGGKLGDASEEAARNTRGDFAAFVEKTKDRARERFERM